MSVNIFYCYFLAADVSVATNVQANTKGLLCYCILDNEMFFFPSFKID